MRHAALLILIFSFFISSCKAIGKPTAESKADLTSTEKMQLDETEQSRAEGDLSEVEYQLQKDSIAREKTFTF